MERVAWILLVGFAFASGWRACDGEAAWAATVGLGGACALVATPVRARPLVRTLASAAVATALAADRISWVWAASLAASTLVVFLLCHPSMMRRVRVKRWRLPAPSTEEELVRRFVAGGTPVAQGWAYWLGHRRAPADAFLVGTNWRAVRVGDGVVVAQAGATFDDLRRAGATLHDRSQYDDLSVGGAIRTGAHGFAADKWLPRLVRAVRFATRDGHVHEIHRDDDPDLRQRVKGDDVLLLIVHLDLVADVCVRLDRRFSRSLHVDRAAWRGATHRALFVTAHGVLVLTVRPTACAAPRVAVPLRAQNALLLWRGGGTSTSVRRLSRASVAVSRLWPIETLAMFFYRNIEAIASKGRLRADECVARLHAFHRRVGGHTEVRESATELAFDLALPATRLVEADAYWCVLYDLGVRAVRFHPGKFVVHDAAPLFIIL